MNQTRQASNAKAMMIIDVFSAVFMPPKIAAHRCAGQATGEGPVQAANKLPRIFLGIAIVFLLTAVFAPAQTSSTLRQKYGQPTCETYKGQPASETYSVRPDIKVTVSYAKSGEVCEMLIAPVSETENGKPSLLKSQPLNEVIDELVPKDQRGTYLMGTFLNITCLPNNDCYGTDESYKRLSIFRNGGIDAYRYASIHWKRDACKTPASTKRAQ